MVVDGLVDNQEDAGGNPFLESGICVVHGRSSVQVSAQTVSIEI